MIKRSTWIILGIFIVLIAVAIYLQNQPQEASDVLEPTIDLSILKEVTPIYKLDEDEFITNLRLTDIMDNEIQFLRSEDTEIGWTMIVTDTEISVDIVAFENSISQLNSLTSDADLDPGTDRSAIGLSEPLHQIFIETNKGASYQVDIGSPTITGNGYYVSVNGDQPLVVNKFIIDALTGYVEAPPYQPTPTPVFTPTIENTEGDIDVELTPQP